MTRLVAALWLALLCIATPAAAQTFPPLTGRVVDNANLLDPAAEAALDAKLAAVEQRSGRQFVVATLPSLEGHTIEDYGYRLGRTWKIGDAQKDDGTLLIVAPNERKVRVETGYGARVFLTDAVSSVIINQDILPRFKAGDYPGGINAGADAIATMLELPPAEAAARAKQISAQQAQRGHVRGVNPFPVFIMIIVFFMVISSIARRTGGRRYRRGGRGGIDPWVVLWGLNALSNSGRGGGGWGGGGGFGGGGGGFSGGGGSFGGGGASGGMVMRTLSEADHALVSAAITAAETSSDGEILTISSDQSDAYHDVGLHYAALAGFALLALFAAAPSLLLGVRDLVVGWSAEPSLREVLRPALLLSLAGFVAVLLALKARPLRMALTPSATKTRRVRRRAIMLFKTGAERRTVGRTGILIYLSLAERRAEIVADEAITAVTTPETWGEAMAALLTEVKAGRPGEGIAAAVGLIGAVLAEHFPKSAGDTNEIPDKLIEL